MALWMTGGFSISSHPIYKQRESKSLRFTGGSVSGKEGTTKPPTDV